MFCTNGVLLRMLTHGDGLSDITHVRLCPLICQPDFAIASDLSFGDRRADAAAAAAAAKELHKKQSCNKPGAGAY